MTALLLLAMAAGDTTVSLSADTSTVRLSGVVRLTLVVAGPAPLRAEPPADPLDAESAANWKLTADGPPTVTAGRWEQRYIADPFVPGEAVPLGFGPVAVCAGGASDSRRLTPEPLTVRVTTGIAEVSPLSARPPTGVESLTEPPVAAKPLWTLPALGGTLLGTIVGLALLVRLNRRTMRQPTAAEWFAHALTELATTDVPPAEFAHRLSDVVRGRLHTDDLPSRRLTTPELPAGAARELLERLDVVRFGGRPLTAAERADMLAAARSFAPEAAR